MTFLQLQQYCSDLWDDPNNQYFTLPMLKLRLNLAQRELQKRLISANQEWFVNCVSTTTVANQQLYAFPTDFLQIVRLEWYMPGTSLTSLSTQIIPQTPNQKNLVSALTGAPQSYSLSHDNFQLYPLPDQAYEIHLEYNYMVADLVADGDIPDFREDFHEYIAVLAARDGYIKDGRSIAPIEQKLKEYETLLKQVAVQRQADFARMGTVTRSDSSGMAW